MKILVIDDEKPTLSMFKLFLTAYGYEVHTAESGEEGLGVFGQIGPEIVFTDIRMPGIDGLEVLARIRKKNPACQVIIITGHGDLERAVEALDLEASDFINKPVERQALNAALIRAEKRVLSPGPTPFSADFGRTRDQAIIKIKGRMTAEAGQILDAIVLSLDDKEGVVFAFDPGFSILRSGISLLMDLLSRMVDKGHDIEIQGLSYNYLRFFEMAGIHKLARLHPAQSQEPGA